MATFKTDLGDIELPKQEVEYLQYRGYRGESLLKKAGVQIHWTEETITEFTKCAQDPVYFIETYMKIIHVDHGLIPFKLRNYQVTLVNNFHEFRRNIITMARQSGKSTAVIGYLLWYILFNKFKTVMILANKADTAREILGKAQLAFLHLPKFLQQGVMEWNKGSIVFENGSRAIAESTSADSIRGYTANILVIDEAAHIDHWEEFSKSVIPVITSGQTTKIVMISTPCGLNHFYKTWRLAELYQKSDEDLKRSGLQWNGYVPLMVPWQDVPGRDQKWHEETLAELNFDTDKFAQEYECQFLGSSGTLVAGWKLKELVAQIPIFSHDGLKKYVEPRKEGVYVITCDTSEGKGLDFHAFSVTDIGRMPYEQVCVYRSNLSSYSEFAQILYAIATTYNNASVLMEYTNMGPTVVHHLIHDFNYDYVLHTESAGSQGKRISTSGGKMVDAGCKMTPHVKAVGCSMAKLLIEQTQYIINDHDTIEEFSRFSKKNNTYKAEEGAHDDLVMGIVLFAWLSGQDYFREMADINTIAKLRDKTEAELEEELAPMMIFDDHGDSIPAQDVFFNPDQGLHNAWTNVETLANF